jgi:hypothetical protein
VNRRLIGIALALGIAGGLAGACSASSGGAMDSAAMAPEQAKDASGAGGAASNGQPGRENISQPGVNRSLVRTATIELSAADVGKAVNQARDIATTEGGYSGREEVREESATLTLRIPSDQFDKALGDLSELGKVTSLDQSAEDVTEKVVDLDSRIATQRASVDRVRALLAKAGTVDEIVRIEGELTNRESDLESLEQRRQALGGQVAMSTVTIRISKSDVAPVVRQETGGFVGGLSDGWDAFLTAGGGTLRVLGAVLPFLLVLGIPAALVFRWRRRRRTAPASS